MKNVLVLLSFFFFGVQSQYAYENHSIKNYLFINILDKDTGTSIKKGQFILISSKVEPLLESLSGANGISAIYFNFVSYIAVNCPGYKIKIIPKNKINIENGKINIKISKKDSTIKHENFEPLDNNLILYGKISRPSNEIIWISNLWEPFSPDTIYMENNIKYSINLEFGKYLNKLPNILPILFCNNDKHLPSVYYAIEDKSIQFVSKRDYKLSENINFNYYDFTIAKPFDGQNISNSDISFKINSFSFNPQFGEISFSIPELDTVIYRSSNSSRKNYKYTLTMAYKLLKRNKVYTFRASYYSKIMKKLLVRKEIKFDYVSRSPGKFIVSKIRNCRLGDTLFVSWEKVIDPDPEDSLHYNVIIHERIHKKEVFFSKTKNNYIYIPIDSLNFEENKSYLLKIIAEDIYGMTSNSKGDGRYFRVKRKFSKIKWPKYRYPFVVAFEYHNINKIYSNTNFNHIIKDKSVINDYFNLSIGRTDRLWRDKLFLTSVFSLYSFYGLGITFMPQYKLKGNDVFLLSFFSNVSSAILGNSLNNHNNIYKKLDMGLNFDISLGESGYCDISSSLFTYNFIYLNNPNTINKFVAKGWEFTVKFVVPRELIPDIGISIFNANINLRQVQFQYGLSKAKNKNIGSINEQKFGIAYLFR